MCIRICTQHFDLLIAIRLHVVKVTSLIKKRLKLHVISVNFSGIDMKCSKEMLCINSMHAVPPKVYMYTCITCTCMACLSVAAHLCQSALCIHNSFIR